MTCWCETPQVTLELHIAVDIKIQFSTGKCPEDRDQMKCQPETQNMNRFHHILAGLETQNIQNISRITCTFNAVLWFGVERFNSLGAQ